jgi:hypothetical protein
MPRTLTAPPTDRSMWRKLLRVVHPDSSPVIGDGELFVWCRSLQEYVVGDHLEEPPKSARRDPPKHPTSSERIDYTEAQDRADSFDTLTRAAVMYAEEVGEPYASVLRLLSDCREATPQDVTLYRAQHVGASYKQVALIAHLVKMSTQERSRWYRIAESIPLAQRHAGHMISTLSGGSEDSRQAKPGAA